MNEAHRMCGSDEWRQAMREVILPWALGDTDLGEDVLEVGPVTAPPPTCSAVRSPG